MNAKLFQTLISKMNLLFVVLVIISSVVGIEEKSFEIYKTLCQNSGPLNLSSLVTLMKDHRSGSLDDNCDHSLGFHFNTELCQSFDPSITKSYYYTMHNFSAFLSDDDKYLYVYIALNIQFERGGQSGKALTSKFRDGYFSSFVNDLLTSKRFLFVVWLKEKRMSKSSHSYQIQYSSGRVLEESGKPPVLRKIVKLSKRIDQQIVLKDITLGRNYDLSISSVSEPSSVISDKITIRDSYLIFCKKTKNTYKNTNCKPVEENEKIRCDCLDYSTQYISVVVIIYWCVVLIVVTKPMMEVIADNDRNDKTVFHIQHNCNERNFKYKYVLVLRLAKSSTDFNLKNVTIDAEFFTQNHESIAPNFRFKAQVLENRPVTDIKLIMWRLTKMPEIKQIQVSHSGKAEGKICLLGVFKQCIIGEAGETLAWYKTVKNISRTQRQFNLRKFKPEQDAIDPEEKPLKRLKLNEICLTTLEVIFVLFVDILFMALISSVFPLNSVANVFTHMLVSIVLITTLGIAFHFVFVLFYKYLLLTELRQQTRMHSQNEKICFIVILVFYGLSIFMAIIFTAYIIVFRESDSFIVIYRWIAVTVCSSALMALVWNVFTHWEVWFPPKTVSESSDLTVNSASINEPMV